MASGNAASEPSTINHQLSTKPALDPLLQQQPMESHRAYSAFRYFLELGPKRSLVDCAAGTERPLVTIKKWAASFEWGKRAARADELRILHLTGEEAKAKAFWRRRLEALREIEWSMASELARAGLDRLEQLQANPEGRSSLSDLAHALEVASKLGRLAAGLPTEKHEHSGPDNTPIRIEFEAALRKIYGPIVDAQTAEGASPLNPTPALNLTLPPPPTKNQEPPASRDLS